MRPQVRPFSLRILRVRVFDGDSMSIISGNKNSQLRETRICADSCDLTSEEDMKFLNDGLMSPSLIDFCMTGCNMSGSFPSYKQRMCQNLVELVLIECEVKVDVLEFGKYPMLQHLSRMEVSETLIFPSNSFPQLKELNLDELHNLKIWEIEERAMPKLTKLVIRECLNLEKVPYGLRFFSTLRSMRITKMPREFMERVNEEDYGSFVKKDINMDYVYKP